ncbi:MAG: hypothetical protein WD055_00200 [Candidatus Dependentiae bacterium]
MVKKIMLYLICICTPIVGCPMGLGKKYQNKPPFFHHTFYTHQKEKPKQLLPMSCKNSISKKIKDIKA